MVDECVSDSDRCKLVFGLLKAMEDLGDFENCFHNLAQGKALKKKMLNYEILQDIELFETIIGSYESDRGFFLGH